MTMANSPACLCCKVRPCGEPVVIINLQAATDATLLLPLPVCADCCNYQQMRAALDTVCMDLFPYPVRLQMLTYQKKEGSS
jgi:hypothetical protein